MNEPWCNGGDCGMNRFPSESSRVGRESSTMRRFLEVVDDFGLKRPSLMGDPFTLSGGINS